VPFQKLGVNRPELGGFLRAGRGELGGGSPLALASTSFPPGISEIKKGGGKKKRRKSRRGKGGGRGFIDLFFIAPKAVLCFSSSKPTRITFCPREGGPAKNTGSEQVLLHHVCGPPAGGEIPKKKNTRRASWGLNELTFATAARYGVGQRAKLWKKGESSSEKERRTGEAFIFLSCISSKKVFQNPKFFSPPN